MLHDVYRTRVVDINCVSVIIVFFSLHNSEAS